MHWKDINEASNAIDHLRVRGAISDDSARRAYGELDAKIRAEAQPVQVMPDECFVPEPNGFIPLDWERHTADCPVR